MFAACGWFPHGGLALGNSLATAIEMVGLVIGLRRRLGGLAGRTMIGGVARAAIATTGMGIAVIGWGKMVAAPLWLIGAGGAMVGAAIYFLIALIVRSPEMRLLRRS